MVKLKPKMKMQPVGDRRVTVLVGLGTALTSLALTVISSAMGSTNWVTVTVDRAAIASLADDYVTVPANDSASSLIDALYNDRLYYSRSRGLFQTCYDHDSQIFSGNCFKCVICYIFYLLFLRLKCHVIGTLLW